MSQQYDYPPQYSQYPPQAPQTSTAAVVSLIASILGIIGILPIIGSIVGIIAGNSAKSDIRNRPGQVTGEGLAQAGVIVGWVGLGLAVLGICAAVAFFTFFGGVGACAALSEGNRSSLFQLAPFASLLIIPVVLKLRH